MKKMLLISAMLLSFNIAAMNATEPVASIILSEPFVENNLEHIFKPDNPYDEPYTVKTVMGDLECIQIPAGKYGYFKVTNNAITSDDSDLIIKVTYFDAGTGDLSFQYNSSPANGGNYNYKPQTIRKTGTNTWITATIAITDASFRKAQNQGADFRINENNYIREISIALGTLNPADEPLAPVTGSDYSEFMGKSVAGYQAWFATGDQSSGWVHWYNSRPPAKGRVNFEIYPDVTEYNDSDLAQTALANLGNEEPSELFNSANTSVIEKHFEWMKEYGIDGVALQRFINGIGTVINNSQNAIPVKVMKAAEATHRIFYICYDISSTGLENSWADIIKFDWVYNIEQNYQLTQSPLYAKVGDKPVVQIWGTGFTDNHPGTEAETIDLINFLKSRGCYVIGGVPTYWRDQTNDSKPNFINAYNAYDMLSPWMVGRFQNNSGANGFISRMKDDKSYCAARNIDYMPVIYPGFAWSQWNNGDVNFAPRNAGDFMWNQAVNIKNLGVSNMYFAMFDEYDEGTAIMKAATDWSMIPTDQYFLTMSADGYWVSSDFQLRVAGAAIEMLKGTRPVTSTVPVPHSEGPVYYRNSFEMRTTTYNYVNNAPQKTGTFNVDPCFKNPARLSMNNMTDASCEIQQNMVHSGLYSVKVSGNTGDALGGATYYYKIADVQIPVEPNMSLSFWKYTDNDPGRFVFVDLTTKSGKNLRDYGYVDQNGSGMYPGNGHGTVGMWNQFVCTFGKDVLLGDTITGIVIGFESMSIGSYTAYFDDFLITTDDVDLVTNIKPVTTTDNTGHIFAENGQLYFTGYPFNATYSVYTVLGQNVLRRGLVSSSSNQILSPGIYIIKVEYSGKSFVHKLLVSRVTSI